MKFIFSRLLLSLLGLVALAGCTKPGVDVGSLGKLVQAPQLKSGGVANIDFGDGDGQQKYLSFTGSCDVHVTKMQIGFKLSESSTITYKDIPATSDYYANSTDATTTHKDNDIDCSDGNFDFILSLWQVETLLGVGTGQTLDDIDVTDVYLVGVTSLGYTTALDLPTGSGNGGGNNDGGGVATQLRVAKMDPQGFAPAGDCDALTVYLSDDSGNYASSITSAIPFGLNSTTGGTSTAATLYSSLENCRNNISSVTSLSLPAGSNSIQAYTRFSGTAGTYENVLVTSTALTSLGLAAGGSYTVTLRGTTNRWVQINDLPQMVYKNECYSGSATFYKYTDDFEIDTTYASTVTMNFSSANTAFAIYTEASCSTTPVTSLTFPTSGTLNFYVKYTSTATSDTFVDFSMVTSATSSATFLTGIDTPTRQLRADLSSHNTITAIDFVGPNQISANVCSLYNLSGRNQNGTPIQNGPLVLNIVLSAAGGSFYSDSSCSAAISETSLPTSAYRTAVYYRSPSGTANGTYALSATPSGGTATSYNVNLYTPVTAQGLLGEFTGTTGVGVCTAINVTLKDSAYTTTVTPDVSTTVDYSVSGDGFGYIHLDSNCSDTGQDSGSFSIPAGQSSMVIYFTETSVGSGTIELTLPSVSGSFSNIGF